MARHKTREEKEFDRRLNSLARALEHEGKQDTHYESGLYDPEDPISSLNHTQLAADVRKALEVVQKARKPSEN